MEHMFFTGIPTLQTNTRIQGQRKACSSQGDHGSKVFDNEGTGKTTTSEVNVRPISTLMPHLSNNNVLSNQDRGGEPQAAPKAQAATSTSAKHDFSVPPDNHENLVSNVFFHLLRQCHKCGTSNGEGLWHCPRCGETLMKETLTKAPPPPPQPQEQSSEYATIFKKSDDDPKQAVDPRTYFQGVGAGRTSYVD